MTHIEEDDQDLYEDVSYVLCELSYCEQELKDYNKAKQEKSLTPEQRFDDVKRIGKLMSKVIGDADHVLELIRIRKADELQEQSGFFRAMYLAIYDLLDRLIWRMYGDLSEPYED